MKLSSLLIGCIGVCTTLLGAYCIYAEAAPILRGGDSSFGRLGRMASGREPIGMSLISQNFVLRDCQIALGAYAGISMRLQDEAFRVRIPELCAEIGEQVLSRSPAHGQAQLVLAQAVARHGDLEAMDMRLRASQALSPGEGRFATARVALAEANIAALSADGLERHQSDLLLLIRGGGSVWTVAQLYVENDSARPRVSAALEHATPPQQSRFLNAVRHMLDLQDTAR